MDAKRIADIGEVHWHDGQPYFLFGNSDNGLVFKDYEAYKKDWDAPCYVPEYAAEDNAVTVDGIEYECGGSKDKCDWYSHNDLLKICRYNQKLCDSLFDTIDWCYPETWLDEREDGDMDWREFYDFVKVGSQVYWEDPDNGLSSGYYDVLSIHDDNKPWHSDTIVVIANGYSEAEVPLNELMSDEPDKLFRNKQTRPMLNFHNKYSFIKMGVQVRYDPFCDGNSKVVQVCTAVPEVIEDDTLINIITVDDGNDCDEITELEPAKACELKPCLTDFNKGYWCAVQDACSNDCNDTVIRAMLKGAGFTYDECIWLIEDSDFESERLMAIINSLL